MTGGEGATSGEEGAGYETCTDPGRASARSVPRSCEVKKKKKARANGGNSVRAEARALTADVGLSLLFPFVRLLNPTAHLCYVRYIAALSSSCSLLTEHVCLSVVNEYFHQRGGDTE